MTLFQVCIQSPKEHHLPKEVTHSLLDWWIVLTKEVQEPFLCILVVSVFDTQDLPMKKFKGVMHSYLC